MERRTPGEIAVDAWRVVRMRGFWVVLGVLSTTAVTVGTKVVMTGWHGYEWLKLQREELDRADRSCAQAIAAEVTDRTGKTDRADFHLLVLEAQARAMGREHVRFVSAYRKADVKAALKQYDELVQHWPCTPTDEIVSASCYSPAQAEAFVLKTD